VRKIDADRNTHDETAPVETLSATELAAAIYRLQGRTNTRDARLYGKVNATLQNRLTELVHEQASRLPCAECGQTPCSEAL